MSVECGDRCGVHNDAAFPSRIGSVAVHGGSGQADGVECANQIDVDHAREAIERQDALASEHALGGRDARGVDETIELTEVDGSCIHCFLNVGFLCHVALHKADNATDRRRFLPTLLVVQVENDRASASSHHHVHDGAAQA